MKRLALLGVLGALSVLVGGATVAVLLERHAAHHSPWARSQEGWYPRQAGIAELASIRQERVEATLRRAQMLAALTPETMVELGREIVHGRGLCFNCHQIGTEGRGVQGPNLLDIGIRAGKRTPALDDVDYLAQSLYFPEAYIVEGYTPSMTAANQAPISLDDDEILMVIAYLQTLGGRVSVRPGQAIATETLR